MSSPAPNHPERHNAVGNNCPVCYRRDSLVRSGDLHECGANPRNCCGARFKFLPATEKQLATLERVPAEPHERKPVDAWRDPYPVGGDVQSTPWGERIRSGR